MTSADHLSPALGDALARAIAGLGVSDEDLMAIWLEAAGAWAFQLWCDYLLGRRSERLDRLFCEGLR